jgi:hypothetical protein
MSYSIVNSSGTDYAVDWGVVERLCRSYYTSYYQLLYADTTLVSERTWNPLTWSLPMIRSVDIPWDKVRSNAQVAAANDMPTYARWSKTDMRGVALDLKSKVEQTAVFRRALVAFLKEIQAGNMDQVEKAVNDYTGLADAARFCRDTSAEIIAIGSTIATGGGAVGLLGASSVMKGFGKYQDTGSVGAAALYGTGSLVIGAFKIGGAKLTTSGEYTLIIVQGSLETGTSLVAGDTFSASIEKGGLKIASSGAVQAVFGTQFAKQVFSRIPVPFNVWALRKSDGVNTLYEDEASTLLEKTTKKLAEKSAAKALKAGLSSAVVKPTVLRMASAGLADEVPVEELFLLYLAIVNMKKGIGRGW